MATHALGFDELMQERRMQRISEVIFSEGLEGLNNDDFIWLQEQIDIHSLHRFPPTEYDYDNPF